VITTTEDFGSTPAGEHNDQSINVAVARYVRLDLTGLGGPTSELKLTAAAARALAERLIQAADRLEQR
jgi:hypothetical protein